MSKFDYINEMKNQVIEFNETIYINDERFNLATYVDKEDDSIEYVLDLLGYPTIDKIWDGPSLCYVMEMAYSWVEKNQKTLKQGWLDVEKSIDEGHKRYLATQK